MGYADYGGGPAPASGHRHSRWSTLRPPTGGTLSVANLIAMDGTAGVTQDAVPVGGEFAYRFVAGDPGTYWYHSHQDSNEQVLGGLLGPLMIRPRQPQAGVEDYYSINGHLYPDVPMFMVREGDIVRMHLENHSGDVHPMHLHGHTAVVLARNGVAATGGPWPVDSLNVENGESYDIAFVANSPGIWIDHCHNLQHAAQGMVAHLMYRA